jgi:hypothetical protein
MASSNEYEQRQFHQEVNANIKAPFTKHEMMIAFRQKALPVYELKFDESASAGIRSIALVEDPLPGYEFIKTHDAKRS